MSEESVQNIKKTIIKHSNHAIHSVTIIITIVLVGKRCAMHKNYIIMALIFLTINNICEMQAIKGQ